VASSGSKGSPPSKAAAEGTSLVKNDVVQVAREQSNKAVAACRREFRDSRASDQKEQEEMKRGIEELSKQMEAPYCLQP